MSTRHEQWISAMGKDLGEVFGELHDQVVWLHVRWRQYEALFGTSTRRVEILNNAASLFFHFVQDSLWDDTLLHLSRLTDRPEVAGKQTLSLRRLPDLCSDAQLREEIERLVKAALDATDFARDWRNRRIAHIDLALALREGAKPLAVASRAGVSAALASVASVLNRIASHYCGTHVVFEGTVATGEADALLYVLRDGLRAEEELRKRVRAGSLTDADLARERAL